VSPGFSSQTSLPTFQPSRHLSVLAIPRSSSHQTSIKTTAHTLSIRRPSRATQTSRLVVSVGAFAAWHNHFFRKDRFSPIGIHPAQTHMVAVSVSARSSSASNRHQVQDTLHPHTDPHEQPRLAVWLSRWEHPLPSPSTWLLFRFCLFVYIPPVFNTNGLYCGSHLPPVFFSHASIVEGWRPLPSLRSGKPVPHRVLIVEYCSVRRGECPYFFNSLLTLKLLKLPPVPDYRLKAEGLGAMLRTFPSAVAN
jgi:hypothetical protein